MIKIYTVLVLKAYLVDLAIKQTSTFNQKRIKIAKS